MYCPKCGQQQISDEMRFCSRCGQALSGLAEWLGGAGVPATRAGETQVSLISPRRKGIRRAGKLMFASGVLFPVFLVFSLLIDEGAPMVVPIFLFFISVAWMLYARLFSDKTPPVRNQDLQTSSLESTPARGSLPAASNMPIPAAGSRAVRTHELAQPPSVTDHTTRLLDHE